MRLIILALLLLFPANTLADDAKPPPSSAPAVKKAPAKKPTPKPKPMVKKAPPQPPDAAAQVEGDMKVGKGTVKILKDQPSSQPTSQPVPTPTDPAEMITSIVIAFKNGKWWIGLSFILMLLTYIFGLVKKNIPPKALPWVAAGLGVLTNFIAAGAGGMAWWEAAVSGLFQGAAAAGLWSLIGKHFLQPKKEAALKDKVRNMVSVYRDDEESVRMRILALEAELMDAKKRAKAWEDKEKNGGDGKDADGGES